MFEVLVVHKPKATGSVPNFSTEVAAASIPLLLLYVPLARPESDDLSCAALSLFLLSLIP